MSEATQTFRDALKRRGRRAIVLGEWYAPVAAMMDALLIVGLSIAVGILYHLYSYNDIGVVQNFARVGALTALFFVAPRSVQKQYDIAEIFADPLAIRRIFHFWNFAIFCVLVIAFLAKLTDTYSRGAVIMFYFSGLFGLAVLRAATMSFVRRGFRARWLVSKRLMLLGTELRIRKFHEHLAPAEFGLEIAGIEILPEIEKGEGRAHFASRISQTLNRIVEKARLLKVENIVLLLPWSDSASIQACREAFLNVPAATVLAPEQVLSRALETGVCRIGRTAGLNLVRAPLGIAETFAKRTMDLLGAAIGLVLLSPLLTIVAILIKLDSRGPVFFRQYRHGFNQKPFRIIKFRTMSAGAGTTEFRQATQNDPRVTRIGCFLRRWNIDELPQIINVLKGEMSIVGPRPHALVHNHEFQNRIASYARRHNVKPGITGWAQVNGFRGQTNTEDKMRGRVEHDLYYIDNWSLWFDVQIILMTLFYRKAFHNAC